ncbi:MAG: hypothetical protein AMXMBFR59_38560 [Rhodanobacteraceae bacterium]
MRWANRAPDRAGSEQDTASVSTDPGDPAHAPASFSRFVLPFAYSLERCVHRPSAACPSATDPAAQRRWKLAPSSPLDDQHQYFTPETADVLYRRARVATLVESEPVSTACRIVPPERLALDGGRYEVMLEPPRLVLFEWPVALRHARKPARGEQPGDDPMQVGFLWREAWFPRCRRDGTPQSLHLADLLRFNELYRYVRQPYDGHRTAPGGFDALIPPPGDARQADADPYFDRWYDSLTLPLCCPDEARGFRLFPRRWEAHDRAWARSRSTTEAHAMCHPDNRAFVVTFAQVAGGANGLLAKPMKAAEDLPPPGELDERTRRLMRAPGWLALLNVDKPGNFASAPAYWQNWAEARTYARWAHYGTLYGFSPHSAAAIADECNEPPVWKHFRGHYFDQTLLLLYLRAVIFRISQRINAITSQQRDRPSNDKSFYLLSRRISDFVNLYQFPFLSLQQQGVEMYALQRLHMDIDDLYREVCEEVQRTQAQNDMEEQIDLSRLATWGLPMAAAALAGVAWNDLGLVRAWEHCFGPTPQASLPAEVVDPWSVWAGVWLAILAFLIMYRYVKRGTR